MPLYPLESHLVFPVNCQKSDPEVRIFFLFDIFTELKRLSENNIPVRIEWFYEEEDLDMKEAGEDIADLADMQFIYTCKKQ